MQKEIDFFDPHHQFHLSLKRYMPKNTNLVLTTMYCRYFQIFDTYLQTYQFVEIFLLETIEHIPPDRLSKVERAIFNSFKPNLVLITTPNQECNELLGVPSHRLRHPEHEFEWTRAKFESWASGVGDRNGYHVTFQGIGWSHPSFGAASQMASFVRAKA